MATSKTNIIANWVNTHPMQQFSTTKLANELGVSLPTLLSYIKANSHKFNKVKHGTYQVMATASVTEVSATTPENQIAPSIVINTSFLDTVEDSQDDDSVSAERPFEW